MSAQIPAIKTLKLLNFRSIRKEVVRFDNPTIFVGRNGAGKSNLVDALAFLADAVGSTLQVAFDKRGGIDAVRSLTSGAGRKPPFGIGVELGPLGAMKWGYYAFELRGVKAHGFELAREECRVVRKDGREAWFQRVGEEFKSSVRTINPVLQPTALALPVVGGIAEFVHVARALLRIQVYSIQPETVRDLQDPDDGRKLREDGSNVASVLREIDRRRPGILERMCEILATIVPNLVAVRVKPTGAKLTLEFTQGWGNGGRKEMSLDALGMSDGALRAVGILAAVEQRARASLLAIEEPEATIHVGALGTLLDVLLHATTFAQVVLTTHSAELLDAKWIEDRHVRVVEWRDGATRIGQPSDSAKEALQSHLMGAGELLRANVLDVGGLFEDSRQQSLFEERS